MRDVLFALGVAVVAAVAAIAATSATWIFWEAWRGTEREAFRALLGAFSGAFFAFLFIRLGEGLKRVYDRKEKNEVALVRLQHYFNDCLNITGDNVYLADDTLQIFDEKRLQLNELPICTNRFQHYPIEREILLGLTNTDFLNDVYTLNVGLQKLNHSLAATDRSYEQIMEAFISKKIEPPTYVENVRHSKPKYIELREFLLETQDDLVRLFAAANLLRRDVPFLLRVIGALTKSKYSETFEAKLQAEIPRVQAEIQSGAEKSRVRIDRVAARADQTGAAAESQSDGR